VHFHTLAGLGGIDEATLDLMYLAPQIELILGRELARWAQETGETSALPPSWLGNLREMVNCYHKRLEGKSDFDLARFAEDVYALIKCYAADLPHLRRPYWLVRGDRVKMSEALKIRLRGECGRLGRHPDVESAEDCQRCSTAHVDEFGHSVGVIEGLVDYNNTVGPEVEVRWEPDNLRYAYHPSLLVLVEERDTR